MFVFLVTFYYLSILQNGIGLHLLSDALYLYATSLENVLVQGYTPKNSSLIVQNMQNVTITSMFSFHYLASLTIAIYFGQRKKKILNNGDGFFYFSFIFQHLMGALQLIRMVHEKQLLHCSTFTTKISLKLDHLTGNNVLNVCSCLADSGNHCTRQ